jgi:hypothetical protein
MARVGRQPTETQAQQLTRGELAFGDTREKAWVLISNKMWMIIIFLVRGG